MANWDRVMVGVVVALAALAAYILFFRSRPPSPPAEADYYTGPFKAAGRNIYSDINGKQVPPPPDARPDIPTASPMSGAAGAHSSARGR